MHFLVEKKEVMPNKPKIPTTMTTSTTEITTVFQGNFLKKLMCLQTFVPNF